MLINLPGKMLGGIWGGISILFIVLLLMMNLALTHKSLFVRSTLQISLSSPNDPVRNRNRGFITSISQVKLLKPHIFILVCLTLWEKCLFKFERFTITILLKVKKQRQIILYIWWPERETSLLSVFMPLRATNHIFLSVSFTRWLWTDFLCILDPV